MDDIYRSEPTRASILRMMHAANSHINAEERAKALAFLASWCLILMDDKKMLHDRIVEISRRSLLDSGLDPFTVDKLLAL